MTRKIRKSVENKELKKFFKKLNNNNKAVEQKLLNNLHNKTQLYSTGNKIDKYQN
jgi:hypothetical protein